MQQNSFANLFSLGSTIAAMKESLGNLAASGQTVMYLKLTRNQLNSLPSFLLEGLNVVHIIANYNNISSIDEDSFQGMEQALESLDLSQNSMFQVCSLLLIQFHYVRNQENENMRMILKERGME